MSANASTRTPQWLNLFEITNLADLRADYRRLRLIGLPTDEHFDRNAQQIATDLSYELRQPVARIRHDGQVKLAIPAGSRLPNLKRQVVPHAVELLPEQETSELDLASLDETTAPIARAFMQFAIRAPLRSDGSLWQNGRAWYGKQPRPSGDSRGSIDLYDGFRFAVVTSSEGRVFLAVDVATAYVDRLWLPQRMNGGDFRSYRGRRALYHYGPNWYVVQLQGLPGASISEQSFVPNGGARIDVLSYTRNQWPRDSIVASLDPASPALIYKTIGAARERYGALALCKLAYTTQHPEVAGLHRASVMEPRIRFARAAAVVRRFFQHAQFAHSPIRITDRPLQVERRVFPFPAQRFGQGRVLGTTAGAGVTDIVGLERVGRSRLELLLDPRAGPLDRTPFDAQAAVLPHDLPRPIAEDFVERFQAAMRGISGQSSYAARTVLYDSTGARSLHQQLEAIEKGLRDGNLRHGYALLVLPVGAHPDLHHQLKRRQWPNLQIQCANAAKLSGYYELSPSGCRVRPGIDNKLNSYVRNVALGVLSANRKWPWGLATALHYDVYVGIDVLNRIAGITCVCDNAARIFFRDYPCSQPERLTAPQMSTMVVDALGDVVPKLGLHPRSVVVQRDGRSFASERRGLHAAIRTLMSRGVLPIDVSVGIVEVHKSSADHLRLAEGPSPEQLSNPTVGSYHVLGPRSGIVSTTGSPFQFPGTADPLAIEIAEGDLKIEHVLEDAYALSTLIFSAPDKCGRLPVTIRLADDLLEPIAAADPDDDLALYGELAPEDDTTSAEPTLAAGAGGGGAHE